jgi:hypothetical protein
VAGPLGPPSPCSRGPRHERACSVTRAPTRFGALSGWPRQPACPAPVRPGPCWPRSPA